MSERTGLRYGLLGLIVIALLAALAYFVARPPQTPAAAHAAAVEENQLQSLKDIAKQAPVHRKLDIQEWKTAEGAKVLFVEAHELPMFDLRLTFAAGSSQDAGTPGLSMLTNAMLNEGVPGKDTTAIAAGFEDLGASFSNGSYRDMAVAGLRSLSDADKRTQALKLFEQVIGQPTFPEDALARIKNQVLAGFEYQKQNPGKLAGLELFKRLYGEHPYAHSSDGDEKSVPPISREQLQAFHKKAYAAGNVVIALVGDLSRQEAEAIAAEVSKALPQGPALAKTVQPETPKPGLTHIDFPSEQTHLMLAQLGIDRQDPDYAALYLGNQILGGGGFGTRLMDQVREKRGLTYGIYSGFTAMQARGPFMINFQTRAELSEGALKLVQDIVRDYLANGPTQKELDDAKRELAGSFPSSASSAPSVSTACRWTTWKASSSRSRDSASNRSGAPWPSTWTPTPSSSSAPARACRRNPCRHPPPSRPSNPAAFRSIDEQTYCESPRPPRRPGTAADHRWRMAQPAFRLSRRARPATDPGPGPRDPVQLAGTLCRRRTGARSLRRQRRAVPRGVVARRPRRAGPGYQRRSGGGPAQPPRRAQVRHRPTGPRRCRALPGKPGSERLRPGVPRPAVPSEPAAGRLPPARNPRLAEPRRLDLYRERERPLVPRPARKLAAAPGKESRQRTLRALAAGSLRMSPASASIRQRLLALGEPCAAQPAADWQGDIALPAELERFYREVGPLDCTLESAGNPFFLPSLARLWQRQAGYRWHGISGERLSGWQDDWLVVADQGADPFILETGSGRILFDLHGGRGWDPAPCFDDLWQMAASLVCFGEVWSGAGEDILLDDCSVAPRYRQQLVDELQPILGSRQRAEDLADEFGW